MLGMVESAGSTSVNADADTAVESSDTMGSGTDVVTHISVAGGTALVEAATLVVPAADSVGVSTPTASGTDGVPVGRGG
jgi:hypothetical protein